MPVRRIPRSYRSTTGVLMSAKSLGAAEYESSLERDFYVLLDADPSVSRFEVQPIRLPAEEGGGRKGHFRYTPDVLVQFVDPTVPPFLCEVKYVAEVQRPRDRERLWWCARTGLSHALDAGWVTGVITDAHLRVGSARAALTAAQFLRPYRTRHPHEHVIRVVNDAVRALSGRSAPVSWIANDAAVRLDGLGLDPSARDSTGNCQPLLLRDTHAITLAAVWHAVALDELRVDRTQPLSAASVAVAQEVRTTSVSFHPDTVPFGSLPALSAYYHRRVNHMDRKVASRSYASASALAHGRSALA